MKNPIRKGESKFFRHNKSKILQVQRFRNVGSKLELSTNASFEILPHEKKPQATRIALLYFSADATLS